MAPALGLVRVRDMIGTGVGVRAVLDDLHCDRGPIGPITHPCQAPAFDQQEGAVRHTGSLHFRNIGGSLEVVEDSAGIPVFGS